MRVRLEGEPDPCTLFIAFRRYLARAAVRPAQSQAFEAPSFLVRPTQNLVRSARQQIKDVAEHAAILPLYKQSTIAAKGTAMLTRRTLALASLIGILAAGDRRFARAEPPSANDPAAIVNAIYTRAAKGKGDGGGGFVIENKAAKAKYLSKSLIELWAKADAHTPKGDVGPVDFDPVTNSQELDVKSFKVDAEKLDADKAIIAVTITGRNTPLRKGADQVVRYEFVREADKWKIDDIKGASDGEPWSIRTMLADSLKS
jgi:hypothetical protein